MIKKGQEKKTVLVVEDDRSLRAALSGRLRREKYHVAEAKNGAEGLKRAKEMHPNVIVVDVAMPILDGITVIRRVREEGVWGKNVPIIILTNVSSEYVSPHIRMAENICFIIKAEHTVKEVTRIIQECLTKKVRAETKT